MKGLTRLVSGTMLMLILVQCCPFIPTEEGRRTPTVEEPVSTPEVPRTPSIPQPLPTEPAEAEWPGAEDWKAFVIGIWLDQEASDHWSAYWQNRITSAAPPDAPEGWQLVAIDVVIENSSSDWNFLSSPFGELVDSGGYTRAVNFFTDLWFGRSIPVPPGFRVRISASSEIPANQVPATLAISIAAQELVVNLDKLQTGLNFPGDEYPMASLVTRTPSALEIPGEFRLQVNQAILAIRVATDSTRTSVPLLNVEVHNLGGYDISSRALNDRTSFFAVDEDGYWVGAGYGGVFGRFHADYVQVFDSTSTLAPGLSNQGIVALNALHGDVEFAYVVLGVATDEPDYWQWLVLKADRAFDLQSYQRVAQLVEVTLGPVEEVEGTRFGNPRQFLQITCTIHNLDNQAHTYSLNLQLPATYFGCRWEQEPVYKVWVVENERVETEANGTETLQLWINSDEWEQWSHDEMMCPLSDRGCGCCTRFELEEIWSQISVVR